MEKLRKIWDNIELTLCSITFVGMLIFCTIQVVMRFVFSTGFAWSEELSRYLLIWLIFISASLAAQYEQHIRVDLVLSLYPKRLRRYVAMLGDIIWLIFSSFFVIRGMSFVRGVFLQNQVGTSVPIKLGWVYISIIVGFALMCIRIIQAIIRKYKDTEKVY